jgi:hypothetical protein
MARVRTPEPPLKVPEGFVASAVRLPSSSRNQAGRSEEWQTQAWQYWETVGELRAVSTWVGNVLSRARLVPAKREGRMLVPITDPNHPAVEAMDAFYGGPQGQAEMLRQFGVHSTVAGEEYIVNRASDDSWHTLATGKVTQQGSGDNARLTANFGEDGGAVNLDPRRDLVIRVWTPSPTDPTRPDSPTRAVIPTLAQISGYDAHITAQIMSRLSGPGVLFMSKDVSFTPPPDADPNASQADHFVATLMAAAAAARRNPGSPESMVPIVALVPTESLGKNELMHFWSPLDEAVIMMRDAAIKRLALGVDTPPEVLLGVADANHWNAWLSEESAVKAHIEPRLGFMAWATTDQYLRPSLVGIDGIGDINDYFVIADTASIRLRPNRSTEAIELFERGELSGEALRRETGFQPEDAPGKDEVERWLLKRVSLGAVSPEQTAAALAKLGVDLGPIADQTPQQPPDHTRTDLVPVETQNIIPERPALAAACDVLVFRALERAGNKLKNQHPRTDASKVAAGKLYQTMSGDPEALLAGAWDCANETLASYTDDVDSVVATLDFYVRGLLSTQRPHSATVLAALLGSQPTTLRAVG